MEFKNFKKDVEAAFNNMIAENLFVANVDKDLLWMGYLLSFEDETVRQDHNCNACKSFIRHYGKVVAIDPQTYKIKTFWDDVHTPGYEKTAQALAKLVKEAGRNCQLRNNLRSQKACPKMKSNGDSPNSGECVVLKTVSPQILDKLRESGLTVCICCEFEGVAWLTFSPGLPFDIHGEGYDFEELGLIGTEANLRYFEKVTPNYIDCGTDVDKFINTCLQFK